MINQVKEYLSNIGQGGICVAFSGGVDSALILKLATECTDNLIAVTFETFLHPNGDLQKAKETAKEYGVEHHVIKINELDNPKIINNPIDRCYHCKYMLFEQMIEFAKTMGISTIIDGTNFDDLHEYRPGLKALSELGIKSPLSDLKITKAQVREMATELGLQVASRPSAPCLATRIPYDVHIDAKILKQIDLSENYIKSLGFQNVRVRYYDNLARIEIDEDSFINFIVYKDDIIEYLKMVGFIYITLDLEGFRSGSMDVHVKN